MMINLGGLTAENPLPEGFPTAPNLRQIYDGSQPNEET